VAVSPGVQLVHLVAARTWVALFLISRGKDFIAKVIGCR
jgi:hypothetical protein